MVDLLPTTEQMVQQLRDADVGKAARTVNVGFGIAVRGDAPEQCLFAIMIGPHTVCVPTQEVVDVINSSYHWEVVTADEHASLVADRRALVKLEAENAELRRKLTGEIDRNRELATKLDQADAMLIRLIDG